MSRALCTMVTLVALLAACDHGLHAWQRPRGLTRRRALVRVAGPDRLALRTPGTIEDVLESLHRSRQQVDAWIRSACPACPVDRVEFGPVVSSFVDAWTQTLRDPAPGTEPDRRPVMQREPPQVAAAGELARHEPSVRVGSGTIETSLATAAAAAGIPEQIVAQMADLFGSELDRTTGLRPGAIFRVAYEELTATTTPGVIPGRLLAAALVNRGRTHEAFHFATADGRHAGYYSRTGAARGTAFLRYPVAFSRISSPFASARFHPLLRRRMPHHGVDFAAPTGTPVVAVAAGTVTQAGWSGPSGRLVRLRHDTTHESGYAHLSRIAAGITPGATVARGQVIGYVGATGRTTGPHLHFTMYRNGRHIDPLRANLPSPDALSGQSLVAFRRAVARIDAAHARAAADQSYGQLVVSVPPSTSRILPVTQLAAGDAR